MLTSTKRVMLIKSMNESVCKQNSSFKSLNYTAMGTYLVSNFWYNFSPGLSVAQDHCMWYHLFLCSISARIGSASWAQ